MAKWTLSSDEEEQSFNAFYDPVTCWYIFAKISYKTPGKAVYICDILGPVHAMAEEIWKRSWVLFSTVGLTVHTKTSRKHCFSKTLSKEKEFKNAGSAL